MFTTLRRFTSLQLTLCALLASILSCTANTEQPLDKSGAGAVNPLSQTAATSPNDIPFEPYSTAAAVSKIKYMITGTGATDDDVAKGGDSDGLAALVTSWLATPASDRMLMDFFQTTFQQQYISDITDITPFDATLRPDLVQAATESFARTALDTVRKGSPFNTLYTTKSFMMNTMLLQGLLISDAFDINDAGAITDLNPKQNPNWQFTVVGGGGNTIQLLSNNPADSNYMTWMAPSPLSSDSNCAAGGSIVQSKQTTRKYASSDLWYFLVNGQFSYKTATGYQCSFNKGSAKALIASDQTDWRLVTLNQATADQDVTPFWDMGTLRGANAVTVRTPRVGYLTTPAFFSQWLDNVGNSARGVTNQSMIVGIGRAFDGSDQTTPVSLAALDANHAPVNSACHACHVTMDPMRQYFRQVYTHKFHRQLDPNEVSMPGIWAVDGTSAVGTGIGDFASRLANHPDVAITWTRRLCGWLNNVSCLASDPEIVRISQRFTASQYNFMGLLQDMLVSPLTTSTQTTLTAQTQGVTPTMARKQALCRALDARLGVTGNCDMVGESISVVMPDSYSRGTVEGKFVTAPNLAARTGLENVCGLLAVNYVDSTNNNLFPSANPNTSVQALASQLMGLPTSTSAPYVAVLQKHFDDSVASGATATEAMKSAFMVACMSPKVVMIGQ